MVFAVQCSMLLNLIEYKNVIEHRYSWSKCQLEPVSFIQDYLMVFAVQLFYVIKCNRT